MRLPTAGVRFVRAPALSTALSCSLAFLSCTACGGSAKTMVPQLQGRTLPQAFTVLASSHLCGPPDIDIKAGLATAGRLPVVVDQSPRAGARVRPGALVTLVVSGRSSGSLS